jgi:Na+/H+ antiporter NhaD/arsenite permease-like protein
MFIFWFATILFIGTYIVIASEKVHKTTAAMVGASLMFLVVLQGPSHGGGEHGKHKSTPEQLVKELKSHVLLQEKPELKEHLEKATSYHKLDVFARYVNFDVIFTLAGMMLLVNILSGTGIFQFVAIKCAKIAKGSPMKTMIMLVIATAVLSAFLDNVTTILLIAPVTLLVASELGVAALPFLMAETMSSNIGGTATLIGDPPNLIIGSAANLDFSAFMVNLAPFIVVILAIYCVALYFYYHKKMHVTVERRARIMEIDENDAISDPVNMKRGGIVMVITIGGFLVHGALGLQPCVIAMSGATLALAVCDIDIDKSLEKIEWGTLFFFMGLFILVNGAEQAGVMKEFGKCLNFIVNWHPLAIILTIMWVCAIAAAVMNNVSFTAAIVTIIASFLTTTPVFQGDLELQRLMWWGLALSVCLGGNGTIVGAAANLITAGIMEKAGQKISFKDFLVYGVPVTFFSLISASLYIVIRFYVMH